MQNDITKKELNNEVEERLEIQEELDKFLAENNYFSIEELRKSFIDDPYKFTKILYHYIYTMSYSLRDPTHQDLTYAHKKMREITSEIVDVFLRHLKKEKGAIKVLKRVLEKNGLTIIKYNPENNSIKIVESVENEENKDDNTPPKSFTKIAFSLEYFLNMLRDWRAEHFYNFFKILNYTSYCNKDREDCGERNNKSYFGINLNYYEVNSFLGLSKRAFYNFMNALMYRYKALKKVDDLNNEEKLIGGNEENVGDGKGIFTHAINRMFFIRKGDKTISKDKTIFVYNNVLGNIDYLFRRNYHAFRLYIYLLYKLEVTSNNRYDVAIDITKKDLTEMREILKFRSNKDLKDNGFEYLNKIGLIKSGEAKIKEKPEVEMWVMFKSQTEFNKMENPYANYYKKQHILKKRVDCETTHQIKR